MRDYSKDFAEWRKWRDEKGLPPIYDNPADAGNGFPGRAAGVVHE